MTDVLKQRWRVGTHYGIHVYAGDTPVATFLDPAWAARAVEAHNNLLNADELADRMAQDIATMPLQVHRQMEIADEDIDP